MNHYTKIVLILSICITICFIADIVAQVSTDTPTADYIFEIIEVPGVDFLEVTASNDFGDYAGNTRTPDGKKSIGFTLIDGVFKTYDFPGALKTNFYALDNARKAAGHYKAQMDFTTVSSCKMENSHNTIFPVQSKLSSTVLVMKREH